MPDVLKYNQLLPKKISNIEGVILFAALLYNHCLISDCSIIDSLGRNVAERHDVKLIFYRRSNCFLGKPRSQVHHQLLSRTTLLSVGDIEAEV